MENIRDYLNTWIKIRNVKSNKYWEVENRETKNGANIRQWSWDENNSNKQWYLSQFPDGGYTITNKSSLKDAEYKNHECEKGSTLRQWNLDEFPSNKIWDFEFMDGSWRISPHNNEAKMKNLVVEVKEHKDSDGADIRLWEEDEKVSNKRWVLEKV